MFIFVLIKHKKIYFYISVQVTEVHTKHHFTLHPYNSGNCKLYLKIGDNSISAAIFGSNGKMHEVCETIFASRSNNLDAKINELNFFLKDFDVLKHPYSHVSVQILNRKFTLAPIAYTEKNVAELLEFNLGESYGGNIHKNLINSSICFAYACEQELIGVIEKIFNTAVIKHTGASTIDLFLKLAPFKNQDLFLNIHGSLIELAIKKNNDLLFYNIFKWDNNEDIVYFLLFTMEQFGLDPGKANISIAANRPVTDELFVFIKKYVRNIQFFVSKAIDTKTENLPNHYYFNILNEHLCE